MTTPQNTIAIVYDYDQTLSPSYMQDEVVFPAFGIDGPKFWTRCSELVRDQLMLAVPQGHPLAAGDVAHIQAVQQERLLASWSFPPPPPPKSPSRRMSLCFKQGSERRATPPIRWRMPSSSCLETGFSRFGRGNRKLATQSFRIEGETFRVESVSNECDHCEGF